MPEPLVLLVGLLLGAACVVPPLLQRRVEGATGEDESDAAAVRHRVAIETLRDVEADRSAGSLDDAAYADQLAQAEARAAATRAALEQPTAPPVRLRHAPERGRRLGLVVAGAIGALLMIGALLPATGLANRVVVNQALADAQAGEAERQDRIVELLEALDPDAPNAATLSALADAYLAGSTGDDLVRAAVTLQLLVEVEPDRADAYERLMTAYLRAGDYRNARAVHDSYATVVTADAVELAFFDGIIALRGENDAAAALQAFERFLELAPDDARAGMVRGLRDEAARGG
jgi:tetratricopeptide (TPR) repeat protein